MDFMFAIAITAGIGAGLLTGVSMVLKLMTFAAFLGWASYFAAGSEIKGLKSALSNNIIGVVWGVIMIAFAGYLSTSLGGVLGTSVSVAICVAVICIIAKYVSIFSFIPGIFMGCSTFFGAGASYDVAKPAIIGLIIGSLLGYFTHQLAKMMQKKEVVANQSEQA